MKGKKMKIRRFEDLNCWQEARKLRKMISEVTRKQLVKKDYVFCDQIKRAALSVMSNIAEGFETNTDKEFINFLNYARRSCGEIRNDLYAALDDGYIDESEFNKIYEQACKTGKMISGFISYLRRSNRTKRLSDD
ncbi:MAG: four helix bundle protein [bacterium]